jgi:ribosomal protein S1
MRIFKKSFLPEINRKSYQSYNLVVGKIVKITKDNIYFDIGFKSLVKTGKQQFLKTYYTLNNSTYSRYSVDKKKYTFRKFLQTVGKGTEYKFLIYHLDTAQTRYYIQFENTVEYFQNRLFFYEFNHIKKVNGVLYGYVLNNVNGGFSVGINGLTAFVPNKEILNSHESLTLRPGSVLNSSFTFKILNINFERKNIVLSRRIN